MKDARRLLDICCVFLQMSSSLFAFFHLCLVSVPFSGPSLTEMKFYKNSFPVFIDIIDSDDRNDDGLDGHTDITDTTIETAIQT